MAGLAVIIAAIAHDPLYLLLFTPLLGYALYRLWEHWHSDGESEDEGSRMDAIVPLPHDHRLPKPSPQPLSLPSLPAPNLSTASGHTPNGQFKTAASPPPPVPPPAPFASSDESEESGDSEFNAREKFAVSDSEDSLGSEDNEGSEGRQSLDSMGDSDWCADPSDGLHSGGAGNVSSEEVFMDLGPFELDSLSLDSAT
jgi:hypothetical protein